MNIFGVGLPEMAVILVLALLVFGPKKLPEIGRSLAKALRGFQEASKEFESEFQREAQQLERAVKSAAPSKTEEIVVANSENNATAPSQQSVTTPSQPG